MDACYIGPNSESLPVDLYGEVYSHICHQSLCVVYQRRVVMLQMSAEALGWVDKRRTMPPCSRRGTRCLIRNQNIVNYGEPTQRELDSGENLVSIQPIVL